MKLIGFLYLAALVALVGVVRIIWPAQVLRGLDALPPPFSDVLLRYYRWNKIPVASREASAAERRQGLYTIFLALGLLLLFTLVNLGIVGASSTTGSGLTN